MSEEKSNSVLHVDFANKTESGAVFKTEALTIHALAAELELETLPELYKKGKDAVIMRGGEGKDAYIITMHPFDFEDTSTIKDKGFRIRVSGTGREDPYHNEIFFSELGNGLFYQTGFYRPLDEHGGMTYPKLDSMALTAFVRRLVEYTPSPVELPAPSAP